MSVRRLPVIPVIPDENEPGDPDELLFIPDAQEALAPFAEVSQPLTFNTAFRGVDTEKLRFREDKEKLRFREDTTLSYTNL